IEARVFDVDAVCLGVDEMRPDVGRMEQALGGDASHQETGSAELGLLFDERCFQSVLAGADSRGVAAGTTPDDDEIVGHSYHSSGRTANRLRPPRTTIMAKHKYMTYSMSGRTNESAF